MSNKQYTHLFHLPKGTAMSVTAYCPGHISGYFKRIAGPTAGETGSIGAGIVIDPGVTVTVKPANHISVRILQRDQGCGVRQIADRSLPLESALHRVGIDASVVTECRLPIGAGFGLSAAALLATLTAVNAMADLGLDAHEIARVAHETEVVHRTGLGDVAACQNGGRVVRTGAGIDGIIHRHFDLPGTIYAISYGPIPTPLVLGSPAQMERVGRAFPKNEPSSAGEFVAAARSFARASGLMTDEVARVLSACAAEGVPAGMTMLGNGVFAWGHKAYAVLRPFGKVYRCRVATAGASIIAGGP